MPAYSVSISFRGRYYYRMGSTKRELTGSALNEFLLKKTGKTWDEVVETNAKLSDIDKKSVQVFLKSAFGAKRFPAGEKLSLKELFSKLQLMEKGKLRRAALVLFGKEPILRELFERLAQSGPRLVRVSGSGSAVIAIYANESQRDNAAVEVGERRFRVIKTMTRADAAPGPDAT